MILFALGAACVVASIGGVAVMAKGGGEVKRDKLTTCFDRAKLYLKQKVDGRDIYVYPTVTQKVKLHDHEAYYFNLPIGVNPKRIQSYMWVFKQGFGDYAEIEGESSAFILRAFKAPIQPFDYIYGEIPIADHKLPIVIGRTRKDYIVYDMVTNPHLLIAGETGSGKSTALRAILTTLMIKYPPSKLQLYLADLKRTEFHLFRNAAHVEETVIEPEEVLEMMERISDIMEERGRILDAHEVAHIDDAPCDLPYIVVCIDEFAELKKQKEAIAIMERVGALGRALGVFLILSTQRPDADILNGRLKAQLTVRLAFRHADEVNSRITLGHGGAEHIKQSDKGRGLLKLDGVMEIQSPYLSLDEAKKLLK
jgi:S-DNA-T family DNA segregation ATPase FtsK/SpoIIIE